MSPVPTHEETIKRAREARERARKITELAREMRLRAQKVVAQIRMSDHPVSRRRLS